MANREKDYSDIMFGYRETPSYYGWYGKDDGGFSVEIYSNGNFIYKTYIFEKIEKTKREIRLTEDVVEKIADILEEHKKDIANFKENINNGSCDGIGNFFIFSGKRIITWNIDYNEEEKVKKENLPYYKKYMHVIRQQNAMLVIFAKISEILERQGISLKLNKVKFAENSESNCDSCL